MKYIVCFSGGHSSAIAAIETVRKYGKEAVILLNHDISSHVEHEDIKRFKREVADYLGLSITYANMPCWDTTPPLLVAIKNKGFKAYNSPAFCTARLKTEPFRRWLAENGECGDSVIYGFDPEETNRMFRRRDIMQAMGYKAVFPLADWERTIYATEEVGIERPDIWEEAKAAEAEIGYSIIKGAYLKDLEPKFHEMRDSLKIVPTDKTNSARFWADIRKAIPEEDPDVPCDCTF